jgi:DNA-binding CsgD family transcriptional regulator
MKATRIPTSALSASPGLAEVKFGEAMARVCVGAAADLPVAPIEIGPWLGAIGERVASVWAAGAGLVAPGHGQPELGVPPERLAAFTAIAERSTDISRVWWLSAQHTRGPDSTPSGEACPHTATEGRLLAALEALPLTGSGEALAGIPGNDARVTMPGVTSPAVGGLVLWMPLPTLREPHWLAVVLAARGLQAELALSSALVAKASFSGPNHGAGSDWPVSSPGPDPASSRPGNGALGTPSISSVHPAAYAAVRALVPAIARSYERCVLEPHRKRTALLERLSGPQAEVAHLLIQGLTEAQIGKSLHRSRHTIHDHVKGVYSALGVSSRTGLMRVWFGLEQVRKA